MRYQNGTVGTCANNAGLVPFNGQGSMNVVYRVAYMYEDGSRSLPSNLTLPITTTAACAPYIYVEFSSPIRTLLQGVGPGGKRRTGIMMQRSGQLTCNGSSTTTNSRLAAGVFVDVFRLDNPTAGGSTNCWTVADRGTVCRDYVRPGSPQEPPVSGWRWQNGTTGASPLYNALGQIGQGPQSLVMNGGGGMKGTYYVVLESGQVYRSLPSPVSLVVYNPSLSQPSLYVEFTAPLALRSSVDSILIQRYDDISDFLIDVARIPASFANTKIWLNITDNIPSPGLLGDTSLTAPPPPPPRQGTYAIKLGAANDASLGWSLVNIGAGKGFPDTQAAWIWTHAGANTSASAVARPTFTTFISAPEDGTPALIHVIADDTAEIYLNERLVMVVTGGLSVSDYSSDRPVWLSLSSGANQLSIRVTNNNGGPAGLLASVYSADGSTVLTRTDSSWTYTADLPALNAVELSAADRSQWGAANIGTGKGFKDIQAMWIWSHAGADTMTSTALRPTFTTLVTAADQDTIVLLHVIVDDIVEVLINDVVVASAKWGWGDPTSPQGQYTDRPLQLRLPKGTSTLSLRVTSLGGAAGVIATLMSSDGRTILARTSSSWACTVELASPLRAIGLGNATAAPWATGPWPGPVINFPDSSASWIWTHAGAASVSSTSVRPTFSTFVTITEAVMPVVLHMVADDYADVLLDGAVVASVMTDWSVSVYPTRRALRLNLTRGIHALSIRVTNGAWGPAGLIASLMTEDGTTVLARTGATDWSYTTEMLNLGAIELAPANMSRLGTINIGPGKGFQDLQAMWIWSHAGAITTSSTALRAIFSTSVTVSEDNTLALLHVIADDSVDVFVNAVLVASARGGWLEGQYSDRPIQLRLPKGTSTLSLRATNTGGGAGIVASLLSSDGRTVLARTNSSWTYTTELLNANSVELRAADKSVWGGAAGILASLTSSDGKTVLARTNSSWTYTAELLNSNSVELCAADKSVWGTANIGPGKGFQDTQAMWIWAHAGADLPTSTALRPTLFSTLVTAAEGNTPVLLHVIVDDLVDVLINGALVASTRYGWVDAVQYSDRPLRLSLPKGTSTLSLRATNTGGAAGILASLTSSDGKTVLARTNSSWTYTAELLNSNSVELSAADKSAWGTANIGPGKGFQDTQAMWIWTHAGADSSSSTALRPTFSTLVTVAEGNTPVLLHVIVDDLVDVLINGALVASTRQGWVGQYSDRPLRLSLPKGTSTLSLRATNSVVVAAGILASLTSSDGKTVLARTNSSWTYTAELLNSNSVELSAADKSAWGTANIGPGKGFQDTQAMWIWAHAGADSSSSTALRPTFSTLVTAAEQDTVVRLDVIADDSADVLINGVVVASAYRGWSVDQYGDRPLKLKLPKGTSTLSLRVTNSGGGAAGIIASLASSDGRTILARTNASWTYTIEYVPPPRPCPKKNGFTALYGVARWGDDILGGPISNAYGTCSEQQACLSFMELRDGSGAGYIKRGTKVTYVDTSFCYYVKEGYESPFTEPPASAPQQAAVLYTGRWGQLYLSNGNTFPDNQAVWIWSQAGADIAFPINVYHTLSATVTVDSFKSVTLYIFVDDRAEIYLNGNRVSTVDLAWNNGKFQATSVSLTLAKGTNVLSLRCVNLAGGPTNPAGVIASLQDSAGNVLLRTDSSSWFVTSYT
ncbi:hypothetical protein PLESTM_000598400 [Pleodorina starrii]|nr:hypothetical protein PLESTM_000598400 [Pleodorina starrii]